MERRISLAARSTGCYSVAQDYFRHRFSRTVAPATPAFCQRLCACQRVSHKYRSWIVNLLVMANIGMANTRRRAGRKWYRFYEFSFRRRRYAEMGSISVSSRWNHGDCRKAHFFVLFGCYFIYRMTNFLGVLIDCKMENFW